MRTIARRRKQNQAKKKPRSVDSRNPTELPKSSSEDSIIPSLGTMLPDIIFPVVDYEISEVLTGSEAIAEMERPAVLEAARAHRVLVSRLIRRLAVSDPRESRDVEYLLERQAPNKVKVEVHDA